MQAGKDAVDVIVDALKMEKFSAGALSVYNDKLIKSQQRIYGMFNMAR